MKTQSKYITQTLEGGKYSKDMPLLNPQSGYIKIDSYLLILCHVIYDVKLSQYLFLSKAKTVFLTLKSFRKQYQNIK